MRTPAFHLVITLSLVLLSSCGQKTAEVPSVTLSSDSISNALLSVSDHGTVRLKDGVFNSEGPSDAGEGYLHVQLIGAVVYGDMNGDDAADAATAFAVNAGGSGTFVSIAALVNHNGSAYHQATYFLGDRMRPDSLKFEERTIVVYFRERTPDQPLAEEGTMPQRVQLRLSGDELLEIEDNL